MLSQLEVRLDNEQNLIQLLTLRDKLYYLVKDIVHDVVSNLEAMRPLKRDDRYGNYLEAYDYLIEYYLKRKALKEFFRVAHEWAGFKFPYPSSYDELGHFFKPNT